MIADLLLLKINNSLLMSDLFGAPMMDHLRYTKGKIGNIDNHHTYYRRYKDVKFEFYENNLHINYLKNKLILVYPIHIITT